MRKVLTDTLLRSLQGDPAGRVEVADAKCSGLTIRVTPAGSRSWSFRFSDPRSGRVTRATLGAYPELSLAAAREKAIEMRRSIARGFNPVEEKRRERIAAEDKLFSKLAARYLDEHARRFKKSHRADDRNLRLHVLPEWSHRRYDEIRRADVIALCEGMVSAGTPTNANRVQALISKVFAFAVDASLVDANPCQRLAKRSKEVPRERTLSDAELRLFDDACRNSQMPKRVSLALRILLLTGVRAGEVAGMRREELKDLASENARWEIPGPRTKNGHRHVIPLSDVALDTLEVALALSDPKSATVFPNRSVPSAAITSHALAVSMGRIKIDSDALGADTWTQEPPTPHDLRRTVATRMASLGVPAEDVAACLNHKRRDVTGVHYDRYDRLREKRRGFQLWANHLSDVLGAKNGEQSNIVQLRPAV